MNELRIDIDVANSDELWCTSIDWVQLSMKLMSPIILVHGNNSDGEFFDRRGFTIGLLVELLEWDDSISMPTDSIAAQGPRLDGFIRSIVTSFGVDSVHIVSHSKGGLDIREYLGRFQRKNDSVFRVLSLTTLSTPHNGSVLADIVVTHHTEASRALVEYSGFPLFTADLVVLRGTDAGTPDLQTSRCALFNAANLPSLPANIVYNVVAVTLI